MYFRYAANNFAWCQDLHHAGQKTEDYWQPDITITKNAAYKKHSIIKKYIMKPIRLFFIIVMLFFCTNLRANNISISNITSVTGSGFVQLQFDLSWENSWRSSINYDAAWVFFKFKDLDGTWRHLNLTNANNSITSGFSISVPGDLTGAMIFRNTTSSGTVTLTAIRVGVTNLPGSFDIKGFALEMVQIPVSDQYYLGDGEVGSYYENGSTGLPFLVNSSTIVMGTTTGQLNDGIQNGALASGFPVGFGSGSMYMMKHELSQAAYRDFLNSLTYDQQTTRTAAAPNSVAGTMAIGLIARRNGIKISTPGVSNTTPAVYSNDLDNDLVYNEATDGEWIACNYLTYMDLAAFLDWSALRPMTELEFEKGCRGTVYPVSGENAAGTVAAASTPYTIINSGAANEAVSPYTGSVLNANITYNATSPSAASPLRVGIHATAFANRISAGAGYYGALDLSGNIEEICVTTWSVAGRSYTGVSGDGSLNAAGDADENFWPGINGNAVTTVANTAYGGTTGVTSNAGVSGRGGSAGYTGFNLNKVSYRTASSVGATRINVSGGRGVKTF